MGDLTRHFAAKCCALGLLVLATTASVAQDMADADTREIMAYKLTEAGFGKYVQATRNLKGLRIDECDEDSDVKSLSEAAAKIESVPGAMTAVQSAGMTSREYVVFAFSLIQNSMAAWALEQPDGKLPSGVSQANVDFLRSHAADLEKLAEVPDDSTCGNEDEDQNGE